MKIIYSILLIQLFLFGKGWAQNLYFPPTNPNAFWDTLSPTSLGWCTEKTDSLYQYLEAENTKAFLVLSKGKIVLEKYFGTFTADSSWYWASAGKTLTSFLIGKAAEENLLKLSDSSSRFLGSGWSSLTPAQERQITIRHHLTMTTGLNDNVPDDDCTLPSCLQFLTNPGSRWAYHNAPYTLLEKVVENASNQSYNAYTQTRLKNQTGITGAWFQSGFNNVFVSRARSMARFGLLALNKFNWNGTALLQDTAFIRQSTQSSQNLNLSYGYLWWLNGKSSYMAPTVPFPLPGPISPDAPSDLYAAIGKNGQILAVVPSQNLVLVRMGNSSSSQSVPYAFLNEIWKYFSKVLCTTTSLTSASKPPSYLLYPNPALNELVLETVGQHITDVQILDSQGRKLQADWALAESGIIKIQLGALPAGIFSLAVCDGAGRVQWKRFIH